MNMFQIDWTNPSEKVSQHFTVRECLWLPQWNRLATSADGFTELIAANLIQHCNNMDSVREALNMPIIAHCTYRPDAYNKLVGGAANSSHKLGQAMDFHVEGMTCDEVRAKIIHLGLLDKLKLRMEYAPGTNWVHLDSHDVAPGGNRFFKP